MFSKLYKRTSANAIQTWEVELDAANSRYRKITGQIDGKKTTSAWTVAKPKNTGRANATTGPEQAIAEATAEWEKKQRDGYFLSAEAAMEAEERGCMKADHYVHEDPAKARKPRALAALARGEQLFSQPKLDGVRLLASAGSMMSRSKRPIVSMPHIEAALQPIFQEHPGIVLDGELYVHDLKDDFDTLVGLVTKKKLTEEDLRKSSAMQYWIYDCCGTHAWSNYGVRISTLAALIPEGGPLRLCPTRIVTTEEQIDEDYGALLGQGYEGQMIRFDAPYEYRRSDKLLKRKEVDDAEFEVLGIDEGDGNRSGEAASALVRDKLSGAVFRANIATDGPERLKLLRERGKYLGGDVTVRFNGRTPSGIPRFPHAITWWPNGRDV